MQNLQRMWLIVVLRMCGSFAKSLNVTNMNWLFGLRFTAGSDFDSLWLSQELTFTARQSSLSVWVSQSSSMVLWRIQQSFFQLQQQLLAVVVLDYQFLQQSSFMTSTVSHNVLSSYLLIKFSEHSLTAHQKSQFGLNRGQEDLQPKVEVRGEILQGSDERSTTVTFMFGV